MARKSSPARRPSKAAKAFLTVASLVGYDPALLLPAPAQAMIVGRPASDHAHLADFAAQFLLSDLTPPGPDAVVDDAFTPPPLVPAMSAFEGFRAFFAGIEATTVGDAGHAVMERFRSRSAFEAEKNPDNANIQRTLRKAQDQLGRDGALRVLLACGVDESFITRGLREGASYNVYAIDKVQDLVGYLAGNPSLNAINRAVLRTMVAFEAAGMEFTMGFAKAAASDKIRVEPMHRPLMRSHTVSASTAPTQASSTMQALVTLGIVISTGKGGAKNPSYAFADTDQARAIKDRLAN